MTQKARSVASRRQPTSNAGKAKTPRAELVLLEIEADDCQQVLLGVLGVVARDGTIPVTLEAARLDNGLAIAIELDGMTAPARQTIAYLLAGYPAVRKVSMAGRVVG